MMNSVIASQAYLLRPRKTHYMMVNIAIVRYRARNSATGIQAHTAGHDGTRCDERLECAQTVEMPYSQRDVPTRKALDARTSA